MVYLQILVYIFGLEVKILLETIKHGHLKLDTNSLPCQSELRDLFKSTLYIVVMPFKRLFTMHYFDRWAVF